MGLLVHLATELQSWLEFVVFTVLPVAFGEIAHWLYEWQMLVTGILVLVAAHLWARAILRAARLQSANPIGAAQRPRSAAQPRAPLPAAGTGRETDASAALSDKLAGLRRQIRALLGCLPCTDQALSAENRAVCERIAQFPLDEALDGSSGPREGFVALRQALEGLAALGTDATGRGAWAALVRISDAAHDLTGTAGQPGRADDRVDWDSFVKLQHKRRDR